MLVHELLGDASAGHAHSSDLLKQRERISESKARSSLTDQSQIWAFLEAYPEDMRQPQKALDLATQLVDYFKELSPDGSVRYSEALLAKGTALQQLDRPAEAEPVLLECMTMRREVYYPEHPETANATSILAEVQAAQGRSAEAEPLLLESYQRLARHPEEQPLHERPVAEHPDRHAYNKHKALERIIALYEAWGKEDKAESWRSKRVSPK
jgi:hypothetical protein